VTAISLQDGETVTCTFTNTKLGRTMIIESSTPKDPQDFSYTDTIPGCTVGPLDDDADPTLKTPVTCPNFVPATYTVTEADPTAAFDITEMVGPLALLRIILLLHGDRRPALRAMLMGGDKFHGPRAGPRA